MESSRRRKALNLFWHAGRIALAAIFLFAGVAKLRDPYAFATAIEHYRIIGASASLVLAFVLPWIEILCSLALLSQRLVRGGLLLSLMLFTLFVAVLSSALVRGLDISCGCFGSGNSTAVWVALVRAILLLLVTLATTRIWYCRRSLTETLQTG